MWCLPCPKLPPSVSVQAAVLLQSQTILFPCFQAVVESIVLLQEKGLHYPAKNSPCDPLVALCCYRIVYNLIHFTFLLSGLGTAPTYSAYFIGCPRQRCFSIAAFSLAAVDKDCSFSCCPCWLSMQGTSKLARSFALKVPRIPKGRRLLPVLHGRDPLSDPHCSARGR